MIKFPFMSATVRYAIGVDLGGTNLRAAAISHDGRLLNKISGSTNLEEGRDAVLDDIASSILSLRSQFGADELSGVGVAVAGFTDIGKGLIVGSNNLPAFDNFPMRDELNARLATPIILENDANAAALGEQWMGAGRGVEDLVLFTLGTGIGGGIISGGRILHGQVGMAGEFGHITIHPDGNPCGCGSRGCLEKHASATAVSAMAQLVALGDNLTSADVYRIAQQDNKEGEKARRIFQAMGASLGIALATVVNIFNFPLYLLSGGVLAAWDLFAPAMMEEVARRSFTFRNVKTRIEKAALGSDAGIFGAARLPFMN